MNLFQWIERLFQKSSRSGLRTGSSSFYTANKAMQQEAITAARRDGEAGRPGTIEASLTNYEHSLVELSQQVIQNAASDMRRNDDELLAGFLEARRDFQSAQLAYERKRLEPAIAGRPLRLEISRWVYLTLVVLLMAGEMAVNYTAFETVFAERIYLTALAAATLGMSLLISAHLVGAAIRQSKQPGWAIATAVLMVGITLGLAYVRMKFIETRNVEEAVFGGVKLDQVAVSAFFFVFNLLFLAAASWMAALRHDPDADYEELHRQYSEARKRALNCKKERDANRSKLLGDARDWVGVCRRLLAQYRESNVNARESKAMPRAWLDNPLDKVIGIDERLFALEVNTDIGLLHDEPDTAAFTKTAEAAAPTASLGAPA